jgi:predicted phosphoribosyltransferase
VFALPRGGVETAVEIANKLEVPLDLLISRKIGHPGNPEYAIGAVTATGPVYWNEAEIISLDDLWCKQAETKEREEAKRRYIAYLADRVRYSAKNKTIIVVDDGIATGLTMQAAVNELLTQKPSRIIVAVPVAPLDAIDRLLEKVDDVVVLINPNKFLGAVGAHYTNFPQLTDEDVINLLEEV